MQKGMYPEAIEQIEKAIILSERNPEIVEILGYAHAAAGEHKEAEKVSRELIESSNHHYIPPYPIAEIYAELSRNDEAFSWLEKAYRERAVHLASLRVDPTFDSLRSDPRYTDLLTRIGLEH